MKSKYETLCILRKQTSEQVIKELKEKFLEIDAESKAQIQERKLAYPIKNEEIAVDFLVTYNQEKDKVEELRSELKKTAGVLREMTINLTSRRSSIGVRFSENQKKSYRIRMESFKSKRNSFLEKKRKESTPEEDEK